MSLVTDDASSFQYGHMPFTSRRGAVSGIDQPPAAEFSDTTDEAAEAAFAVFTLPFLFGPEGAAEGETVSEKLPSNVGMHHPLSAPASSQCSLTALPMIEA